ncbi:MAG TPA: DNA repair protein RadC [Bacteroidales bacterium]|nr:DNA repair protein RadC [Bacteroidales bacterium]HOE04278.1 DNA repair protein RadC [Bacteroidales bacterium]HQL70310.1 DNA repair protein RadC [Bacteroidales bacterium]
MITKTSIKNWASDDRPREKMIQKGTAALSDAELIAILLRTGSRDKSAVELAREILESSSNNLNLLGKKSISEFRKIKGIGMAKAVEIAAALELGRRRKMSEIIEKPSIRSSADAYQLFEPLVADLSHEEFWVALLNRANHVTDTFRLSQGGTAGTVMDVKIIMKRALEQLAHGIIISHNHPSGNRQPSDADRNITRKLAEAAKLFDIQLLDHIVVANHSYYSFADEGQL